MTKHKVTEYWRDNPDGSRTLCAYCYDESTASFYRIADDKVERQGLSIWEIPQPHSNMHPAIQVVANYAQQQRILYYKHKLSKEVI